MDMIVKATDCWTGEKISGRVRYEGKIHHGMFFAVQMNCAAGA